MSVPIIGVQDGEPVCGPDLPPAARQRVLRQSTRRYTASGRLVGEVPVRQGPGRRRARRMIRAAIAGWLLMAYFAHSSALQAAVAGLFFALVAAVIAFRAAPAVTRLADRIVLRAHQTQFIDLADLGETSRAQLLRAQGAIAAVTASSLYRDGMLDELRIREVLRAHHWEIARLLRDLGRLRAEHERRGGSGAATAGDSAIHDIARAQGEALTQTSAAAERRIQAIEAYAEQVRAADAAYLTWQQAQRLAGLNGQCLDLLARATDGDYTTGTVEDLSESATAARAVFQDSLAEAQETAKVLTSALTT
jgi:hypothetical protein